MQVCTEGKGALHERSYPAMHSPGSSMGKVTVSPPCQGHDSGAWQSGFYLSHRLRKTTLTRNKPTARRSGAPPALLAGICLSGPSH